MQLLALRLSRCRLRRPRCRAPCNQRLTLSAQRRDLRLVRLAGEHLLRDGRVLTIVPRVTRLLAIARGLEALALEVLERGGRRRRRRSGCRGRHRSRDTLGDAPALGTRDA